MSIAQLVPERNGHPYLTYDMILEIPKAIEDTLERNTKKEHEISLKLKDKRLVYFTGCGTAYFAATLGEQFLSLLNDEMFRSTSVQAYELSTYHHSVNESCATVGVSHSGITKATVDALKYTREHGGFCVGVTHFEGRPISEAADSTLLVGNSPDKSRCHTKSYVSSAVACARIAMELSEVMKGKISPEIEEIKVGLRKFPQITSKILSSSNRPCEDLAEKYLMKHRYYFVGAGPNVPTALEAALKMKETSFVAAEGMETEQMMHGPWVSLDKDSLLVVISPQGRSYKRTLDLVKAAKIIGVPVLGIVGHDDTEVSSFCNDTVELPEVGEYLSPFTNIIPLYLFSYYSSVKRGFNPDYIRYLTSSYWEARQVIFPPGTH